MTDDSALLAQVREALGSRCGCGAVACYDAVSGAPHMVKLRDCPTCLPQRIAAFGDFLWDCLHSAGDDREAVMDEAVAEFRGAR